MYFQFCLIPRYAWYVNYVQLDVLFYYAQFKGTADHVWEGLEWVWSKSNNLLTPAGYLDHQSATMYNQITYISLFFFADFIIIPT